MSQPVQDGFTAALAILAYLAGSIPFGLLLGRVLAGSDVRRAGSGNIGAANVSRVAGPRVGAVVLVSDLLKGLLPVVIGRVLGLDPIQLAILAGVAVIGHDFSVFLRFRGGKGVATTIGVAAALALAPALCAAVVWVALVVVGRVSAVASLVALWLLPLLMAVFDERPEYVALAFGLAVLGFWTHRDNLARLATGTENRVVGG